MSGEQLDGLLGGLGIGRPEKLVFDEGIDGGANVILFAIRDVGDACGAIELLSCFLCGVRLCELDADVQADAVWKGPFFLGDVLARGRVGCEVGF